jgi:Amt family ammonium transporter
MNTNTGGLAGAITVGLLMYVQYKRLDITMILNGALGGLVSVTAGADMFDMYTPIYVGAIGGAIVVFGVALFDKLRLDDPVGALSVHLLNGIWGTIAVAVFADANMWDQVKGVLVVGVFAFTASFVVMYIINFFSVFRAEDDEQQQGLDIEECGLEAYPEFKRSI